MRAYVVTTGVVFGLVTAAHVLRVIEEGVGLLKRPGWVLITLASAALCFWAGRLLGIGRARSGREG